MLGSARRDGDTGRAVDALRAALPAASDLIDLTAHPLRPFDYAGTAAGDDFDAVVERMLAAPAILFATPVYWYAMSGLMKTLFDRFSDLLSDRDASGRARRLAGRDMWLLAVGADPELPPGFEVPFRMTADYLGLRWRGEAYVFAGAPEAEKSERLARLAARISARPA